MDNVRRYTASYLKLIDKFFELVQAKRKVSTIRLGYVFFTNEILTFKFQTKQDLTVRILGIDYSKKLIDLKDSDAQKDGFADLNELKSELTKFYPTIKENTQFTIVNFEIIE